MFSFRTGRTKEISFNCIYSLPSGFRRSQHELHSLGCVSQCFMYNLSENQDISGSPSHMTAGRRRNCFSCHLYWSCENFVSPLEPIGYLAEVLGSSNGARSGFQLVDRPFKCDPKVVSYSPMPSMPLLHEWACLQTVVTALHRVHSCLRPMLAFLLWSCD